MNPSEHDRDALREFNQERLLDEVAVQLHSAMDTRGVSRADLARALGVKPPTVTAMLNGENNFRLRTLADLFFELNLALHVTTSSEVGRVYQPSSASRHPVQLSLFCAPTPIALANGDHADGVWHDAPSGPAASISSLEYSNFDQSVKTPDWTDRGAA